MKRHKIGMKNYEYECGDGCCSEFGTEWYVDGEYVTRSSCDLTSWKAILQHLGIEAEFVGLDENDEEIWGL